MKPSNHWTAQRFIAMSESFASAYGFGTADPHQPQGKWTSEKLADLGLAMSRAYGPQI